MIMALNLEVDFYTTDMSATVRLNLLFVMQTLLWLHLNNRVVYGNVSGDMATERMSRPPLSPNERSVRHTRVEDEQQIEESYISGEILGQGSFGVVREAVQKETGQKFAIKIINKEKVRFACTHKCGNFVYKQRCTGFLTSNIVVYLVGNELDYVSLNL